MQKFAFIIHPITARDVANKYPIVKFVPDRIVEAYLRRHAPIVAAKVTGIKSITGEEAEGWFIGCPYTPRLFTDLPIDEVNATLEKCGHLAEEVGAKILGLGAFTSVIGDGGLTLSKKLKIAVTTGNSYTVATAIEGTRKAAKLMGIEISTSTVAIVGATGSIGATCAEILAREAKEVVLIGRNVSRLNELRSRLEALSTAKLIVEDSVADGLKRAEIIITVSSAADAIIHPNMIRSGAVVCDVARPRDVSIAVQKERNDVLVIEGGVVRVPGNMYCKKMWSDEPFSFGFPQGTAYACMSETIALALDGKYESFTLGKEVSVRQVDEINAVCSKHGFELDGFRSFERAVTDETIQSIRKNAMPVHA